MNTYEAICTRRSTRKLKAEPISQAELDQVLQAGRVAPTGGNSQSAHFIVIENKKILDELAALAREEFAKMEVTAGTYKSLKNSINASKRGTYAFHYHAPTLIVVANKKDYGNNMADSACAIENMMLEANELNLGTCWINQLHWLDDNPRIHAYMLKLGLAEDETICASMIIGYPDTADGKPIRAPREITGNPVTFVR